MLCIKTILLSLILQSPLLAGESQMQLLSQPILANGGSESWGSPDIDKWKGVADKFNAHDLSVPFTPKDKPPQK
jgi:hypothetical protein